jgi:hypothetical protein
MSQLVAERGGHSEKQRAWPEVRMHVRKGDFGTDVAMIGLPTTPPLQIL